MKRWTWVVAMAPVMLVLFKLVCWADCLHAHNYDPYEIPPPTATDFTRAAIVFWGALLTPLVVGLVAAVVAFRRSRPAHRPIAESCIVAIPLLVLLQGILWPSTLPDSGCVGMLPWGILLGAQFLLGGVVVMALQNLGACARHHNWRRLLLSTLVACGGMLHLFWLYAFIIYIDT
ncbi:MAG: hypothetical protein HN742_31865 [Lentisphaerae bacterium]|jgi:hypothetical protein|nr:hypothetical protein [Lentisphaerota bacterium]MBT7060462.1 hypothetical protein [Lentisphaerota bacterium]MBT7846510.1 hypothetical protein [Lentisphaerota bacterium]